MRRLWLIYVAVLAVAPAAASAGQQNAPAPDRAALLAAEREKKTEETTPGAIARGARSLLVSGEVR